MKRKTSRLKAPLSTAAFALALAVALSACSASNDSQAADTAISTESTADSPNEFSSRTANPDLPPFPELGPFDPDLRGEDMPDPCTWATPELMAELGYPKVLKNETFIDFRSCGYGQEASDDLDTFTISIALTSAPVSSSTNPTPMDIQGYEIYSAPDSLFEFNSYASVNTAFGAYEVAASSFNKSQDELEREAIRVLTSILESSVS